MYETLAIGAESTQRMSQKSDSSEENAHLKGHCPKLLKSKIFFYKIRCHQGQSKVVPVFQITGNSAIEDKKWQTLLGI